MENRIKVLDCTLRDGGRGFGNSWGDETIKNISNKLVNAKIDFIEIGFLWYLSDGVCRENTTLFQDIEELTPFINKNGKYVVYIEYELYKIENHKLPVKENNSIDGIRLGILKSDIQESIETMKEIKEKGYKLFVQGINVLSYSEDELIEFIKVVNDIKPYSFGIVDTFGSLYIKDLIRIYELVDKHLDKNIAVALHSHNNMQLSFALATILIEINTKRELIIDSTLGGIGMGAGNLSTELIINYLNEQEKGDYNISEVVEILDTYIEKFKSKYIWENLIVSYESAIKWCSQINVSYIINAYAKIPLEDKRLLLGLCPPGCGVGKHTIDRYYRLINRHHENSSGNIERLKHELVNKKILIVAGGPSVEENIKDIENYIVTNEVIIIFANAKDSSLFANTNSNRYYFFNNEKTFKIFSNKANNKKEKIICLSGILDTNDITNKEDNNYIINYKDIIGSTNIISEDSTIMLLVFMNLLGNIENVSIVGFDGSNASSKQIEVYKKYIKVLSNKLKVSFLSNIAYK